MTAAPYPPDEDARLAALKSYGILDTPSEELFDGFTEIAAEVCEVPVSLISFVDKDRQWFKSKVGFTEASSPRDIAFCAYTILQDEMMEVPDATLDPRFSDNPLVTGDAHVRFYAGVPLLDQDGHALGTLCVVDAKPKKLTETQRSLLHLLARQVVDSLEQRRVLMELQGSETFRAAILTSALDAIITIDREGRIVEFNAAAESMFGYQRQDIVGKLMVDLIVPEELRDAHNKGMTTYLQTGEGPVLGERIEVPAVRADGARISVELAITPISIKNTVFFTAYLRDISARKRSEMRVSTQQEVTKILAETASFEKAVPLVLEAIGTGLDWEVGVFWKVHRADQVLQPVATWSSTETEGQAFLDACRTVQLRIGDEMPGRVWETGEVILLPGVEDETRSRRFEFAGQAGLSMGVAFPVIMEQQVLGIFEFYRREAHVDETELTELFTSMGSQIGQFEVRKRVQSQFAELNRTLLRLGPDSNLNLQLLASTGGRLLSAVRAMYWRRDMGQLTCVGGWNIEVESEPVQQIKGSLWEQVLASANEMGTVLLRRESTPGNWPEGIETLLAQVVRRGEEVMGVLGMCYAHRFILDKEDAELSVILGTALGIEEARRWAGQQLADARQQEVGIAARIQETLLTGPATMQAAGFHIAAHSTPSQKVDGDFFDVIPLRSGAADIVIGDGMGKGVGAALLGAATKTAVQRSISRMLLSGSPHKAPEPREIVASLHADVVPTLIELESFVTCTYVRLASDGHEFQMVNCGHTSGLIRHRNGSVSELPGENMPLGFSLRETYVQKMHTVEAGDMLVLYSDGIIEAVDPHGNTFGMERLKAFLQTCPESNPQAMMDQLFAEVARFSQDRVQMDDLTVLIACSNPTGRRTILDQKTGQFKAYMAELEAVRDFCQSFCQDIPDAMNEILLAVNEAFTNVVNHGYHGECDEVIEVLLERMTRSLRVQLLHSGDGFAGRSSSPEKIDDRQESGFGMFIMEQAVDRVEYARLDDGRNAIILEKNINHNPEGDHEHNHP